LRTVSLDFYSLACAARIIFFVGLDAVLPFD
jgi:hypothetical protein